MRDPTHTSSHLYTHAPASPSPYPVSIRAYKKKDYDYLSTFPRMAHSVLRATRNDAELLQERSDCESDLSMTTSSVGYTTSNCSTSSTISAQNYAKNVIVAMDAEDHHHHYQQQQDHFRSTQTCTHSPHISVDCKESDAEMKNDKADNGSGADVKDDKANITGDSPGLIEKPSTQVKRSGRSQSRPKPRSSNTPAVLPKFGSWDTRNPSSGDAYTLIFRRLRDEKKSGGLPMCASPTHPNEEGPEVPLSLESKPEEPLHANTQVRKDSSRRKTKGKSHHEASDNRKPTSRWSLCCKASVLDD